MTPKEEHKQECPHPEPRKDYYRDGCFKCWQCGKIVVEHNNYKQETLEEAAYNHLNSGIIPVLTKDEFKATTPLSGGSGSGTIVGHSGGGTTGTISTTDYITGTAYICTLFTSNSPNGICSRCGQPEWKHHNISYT